MNASMTAGLQGLFILLPGYTLIGRIEVSRLSINRDLETECASSAKANSESCNRSHDPHPSYKVVDIKWLLT